MVELETQVREYFDTIAPPTDVDILVDGFLGEVETQPRGKPGRRWRGGLVGVAARPQPWAVVLAAIVLVLVVIGGIAVLVPGGGQAPVIDTPDPVPPTPTTAVTPTTVEEPASEGELIPGVEGSIRFVARWANPVSGVNSTNAVWYLDADTWRWEILESWSDEMEGHILTREGDTMFEYLPIPNIYTILDPTVECTETESDPESDPEGCVSEIFLDFNPADDDQIFPPTEYVCDETGTCVAVNDGNTWEECSISDGGLVAGVVTTRYVCSRQVIVKGSTETESLDLYQHGSSRTMRLDAVIFQDIGRRDVIEYEVLEVDLEPSFDPTLFEFECPTDDCRDSSLPPDPFNHQMIGQEAPPTSGELVRGGTLDLADHRGERIVLNFGASWCPPCTEEWAVLQVLAEENTGITFITGLVSDDPADALAVVNDLDITLPILDLTESENYQFDVWGLIGIPNTLFIDENGVIVAVRIDPTGDLRAIIAGLGW